MNQSCHESKSVRCCTQLSLQALRKTTRLTSDKFLDNERRNHAGKKVLRIILNENVSEKFSEHLECNWVFFSNIK